MGLTRCASWSWERTEIVMNETAWKAIAVIAAYLVLGLSQPHAAVLDPQLSVRPVLPSTADQVNLRIVDQTGVAPTVDSVATTVDGNNIEITAQITLGPTEFMRYYQIDQSAGVLAEGRYAVRYVAQVRFNAEAGGYTPYSAPFVAGAWDFVVLNPGSQSPAIEYYYEPSITIS